MNASERAIYDIMGDLAHQACTNPALREAVLKCSVTDMHESKLGDWSKIDQRGADVFDEYERNAPIGTNIDDVEFESIGGDDNDEYYDDEIDESEIAQLYEDVSKEIQDAARKREDITLELENGDTIEIDAETAKLISDKASPSDLRMAGKSREAFLKFMNKEIM